MNPKADDSSSAAVGVPPFRFLWFFILAYSMVMVFSNWFDVRLVQIFNLDTDAGTLIFPLTFLLSDLITEVYGYKNARRAIWCGFLFNILFLTYGQIIVNLPSPSYAVNNAMFNTIFAANIRIVIASCLSYLISEPINSYIMAQLKIKMHGQFVGIRFIVSTMVAAGTDSIVFGVFAFYGVFTHSTLVTFIATMWLIKVIIEILGLPVSIRLTKKLKLAEKADIYDKRTNFTLMSLNAEYEVKDNEFNRTSFKDD